MRLPPDLPPDLKAGLERLAHGVPRKAVAERAAAQSCTYRGGGGSHRIVTEADVLAYAFARLPATYAAAAAVFNATRGSLPAFQPLSMLDVGAGPGTAAFAAGQAFETIINIRPIPANPPVPGLGVVRMGVTYHATLRQS